MLSRILKFELRPDFAPVSLFNRLCFTYPNAFVSLVAIPGVGTWIGATPELLMSWNQTSLSTVSLAGTNWASNGKVRGWYDKELNEQALVSEYIRECFHGLGIYDYTEYPTETIKIGKLQHLQTKFGLEHRTDLKDLPQEILQMLHPTPAVCGVPKEGAMDFIRTTESHARGFYAGFLGPVNFGTSSELFVNLRCMQLQKEAAILYAGAGITEDSDPKKEWQETDSKLDALLTILYEKERVASNGGI